MMEFTFGKFGAKPFDPSLPLADNVIWNLGFSSQNIGDTRILGAEITLIGQGKLGKIPLTILAGYTYINPQSLNWTDSLQIFDAEGNNAFIQAASSDGTQTYAATSTSTDNTLKYRFNHTFKLDAEISVNKFDFGVGINYTSFMKSVDYLFVSDFIIGFESSLGTAAFSGLRDYRAKNDRGNTDLSARIGYNITDKIKVSVIGKNLLNQEMMMRPAYMSAPRNYTAQVSVEF
jgi:outer membrane cobalamin receptor